MPASACSWVQDFELGVALALRRHPPTVDHPARPGAADLKVLQSGVALDSWRLLLGPHLAVEPLWFHADLAWSKYQSYLAAYGPARVLATCSTHPCGERHGGSSAGRASSRKPALSRWLASSRTYRDPTTHNLEPAKADWGSEIDLKKP